MDKPSAGNNRPEGLVRWPTQRGEADIRFDPPTDGFGDTAVGSVLQALSHVDLGADGAPLTVDWSALSERTGLSPEAVEHGFHEARRRGLLGRVTIEYDHLRWMRQSRNKGCLVVMACVERGDRERDRDGLATECAATVLAVSDAVTNDLQRLGAVYIVPNVHLAPREPRLNPHEYDPLSLLVAFRDAVEAAGEKAYLGSYGYSKMIELAINGSPVGYTIRVV